MALFALLEIQPAWADDSTYPSYSYESGTIYVQDVSAGSVDYDDANNVLTLNNTRLYNVHIEHAPSFTIKLIGDNTTGNSINGDPSPGFLSTMSNAKANPITITGNGSLKGAIESEGAIAISGGSVIGSVKCESFTLSGGKVSGSVLCTGNAKITGGALTKSGGQYALECWGSLTMSGGKVAATNVQTAISVGSASGKTTYKLNMTGGSIIVQTPKYAGITVASGNLVMSGGNISITDAKDEGIAVVCEKHAGTRYGGILKATGGKLTIQLRHSSNQAVEAYRMKNEPTCLKSIKGHLPAGASFKVKGNTYKIQKDGLQVTLMKYQASAKKVKLKQVKFGSITYDMGGVASGAFNTKQGQRVTSLKLGNLSTIGSKAFYGTKSLTHFEFTSDFVEKQGSIGKPVKALFHKQTSISKTAFKGMGKAKGKKLKVRIPHLLLYGEYTKAYKKLLLSKGMPKSFTLLT